MVKLVAFHLPQFHPTPENDLWWGKGFTEWTNVTKAAPAFDGHYQPHLPADLGYYDLRLKASRLEQIFLARSHGVDAFCFHYYWFNGKRLLHEPVDAFVRDPDHDFPFCLSWANENWTRRWDAAEHEVLISQTYTAESEIALIDGLIAVFRDPRYLRVDGKPFFMVYRPQHLPNAAATLERWRKRCMESGIGEVHFACALIHGNQDHTQFGFDSGVEFPPHNLGIQNVNKDVRVSESFSGNIFRYEDVARSFLRRDYDGRHVYRTVFPSWDNTARVGQRALLVLNGTPENYEYWLSQTIRGAESRGDDLVFVNAWNEWAEGCHLEPDRRHGSGFLEATRRATSGASVTSDFVHQGVPDGSDQTIRRFLPELGALVRYHARLRFADMKALVRKYPRLHAIALGARDAIARLKLRRFDTH